MNSAQRLSARDVAALARAWRGGVSAGQLLLRCGVAAAEASAGPGTVAVPSSAGGREIRAAVDGTPSIDGSRVSVEAMRTVPHHIDGDELSGSHAGGLRLGGNVTRVGCLKATGDMVVEQMVDRAELHAGRTMVIEGRATNSELAAGAGAATLQRIYRPAGDAADLLALVATEYGQVAAVAARAERSASSAEMVRALVERRHAALVGHLDEAVEALRSARRHWPELHSELGEAFDGVVQLLDTGRPSPDEETLHLIERCVAVTRAAVPARRPPDGDLRIDHAEQCTLRTPGSVRISGRGARKCTISAGEDVYATAAGCALVSGSIGVGGVMRATELAGTEEAWLRVEFAEPEPRDDLLRADVINPFVEVNIAGQVLRFDRRQDNVRVGIEGGRVVRRTH